MEPGETVADAVVREVREERGLHVTVLSLIGIYSDPVSQVFAYLSGHVSQFITSCFRCEVVGGSLQSDGVEVLDAAFFVANDLPPDLLPMHPRWLADALAERASAFIR